MIEVNKVSKESLEAQASIRPEPTDAQAPKRSMNTYMAVLIVVVACLCLYALCRFLPVESNPCLMVPEAAGQCG
jgi:hypothetical protein